MKVRKCKRTNDAGNSRFPSVARVTRPVEGETVDDGSNSNRSKPTIVTKWTFDGLPMDSNNLPVPDFGSGVARIIGTEDPDGNAVPPHGDVVPSLRHVSDSSSPGNAWRIRSSGLFNGYSLRNLTTGVQFYVPTAGYFGIVVSFDWLATDNAPGHGQFQYTTNGVDFKSLGEPVPVALGNVWQQLSFDLTEISEVDNNPDFGWRFVASYNPNPFKVVCHAEGRPRVALEYGPNEAFINAGDVGADVVSDPWLPTNGNFRFDTIVVGAAKGRPSANG